MAAFAVARRNCLSDGGAESEHPLETFVGVYASAKPGELCLMAAFAVARRNCPSEGGRRASIRCEGGFFVEALRWYRALRARDTARLGPAVAGFRRAKGSGERASAGDVRSGVQSAKPEKRRASIRWGSQDLP